MCTKGVIKPKPIITIMKSLKYISIIVTALLLMFVAACDTVAPQADDLSEVDIEVATQIVGESLSDHNEGVFASLYDALSSLSTDQINYGSQQMAKAGDDDNSGRGFESEYNATYDPETGEHHITFRRSIVRPPFSKTMSANLKYIFTDIDGAFLEFPKRQQDSIETIDFRGTRAGTKNGPVRASEFSRTDTLFLSGVSSATNLLELDGNHHGEGSMIVNTRESGTVERSYSIQIELVDISVDKAVVQENGSLEEGVTGFLRYKLVMKHSNNGQNRERTVEGTIELNGDGTALLRIEQVKKFFTISLRNGDVS